MNTETRSIIDSMGITPNHASYEETLWQSGLDFQVMEDSVRGFASGITAPRMKMLYRSDDHSVLGVMRQTYSASDPREFLQSQYDVAKELGGTVARVGFIEQNAKAFAFIRLDQQIVLPRKSRKHGDAIGLYLYSTDGWNGSTPRSTKLFMERVVCSNGITSRNIEDILWVAHTKNSKLNYGRRSGPFMQGVKQQISQMNGQFVQLANERMTVPQLNEFLMKLLPGDGERAEERRTVIGRLFHEGKGNEGRTRWDAFNAVTEYATHQATHRETEDRDSNLNRFTSLMERPTINEKALNLLTNN